MNSKSNQEIAFLLKKVQRISDKKYQLRVWVKGEGPECDDFDETVNIFVPHAKGVLENHHNLGLTERQYSLLNNFLVMFRKFSDTIGTNYPPGDFIDTPEWLKIMEMAKEVLDAFHWQLPA